ncbi:MAG: VCBS repeat-containing protein [Clostridiaceae bacterium]|nr:VCBS repeat-containing protein [Clostridiaceae bacterium]
MKKKKWIFVSVVIVILAAACAVKSSLLGVSSGDLDNDGKKELVLILRRPGDEYGKSLVIMSFQKNDGNRIQSYDMNDLNPWTVHIADVDGDGMKELSVGVYKKARLDPVMAKRPFLYNWNGKTIYPKWLGSRLSRPFEDYLFCDINDDSVDELISVELADDGNKLINVYRWKGFGFEGIAESPLFEDISRIRAANAQKIRAKVKKDDKWVWIGISLKHDKIEIEWQ